MNPALINLLLLLAMQGGQESEGRPSPKSGVFQPPQDPFFTTLPTPQNPQSPTPTQLNIMDILAQISGPTPNTPLGPVNPFLPATAAETPRRELPTFFDDLFSVDTAADIGDQILRIPEAAGAIPGLLRDIIGMKTRSAISNVKTQRLREGVDEETGRRQQQ